MINQQDNFFWYKLNGLLRMIIVRGGVRPFFDNIIVNEYPKSGGSWIAQMLSEATGYPFPRNRLPYFGPNIMQGHYYHSFGLKKTVIVWRDGRDVLISQYYHWLFGNELGGRKFVYNNRKKLGFEDLDNIHMNLPKFIEHVYSSNGHPVFSWADFVNKWYERDIVSVKYENMRLNPTKELQRVVAELTNKQLSNSEAQVIVDKYSFEKQTGRVSGEEKKGGFIRKGIVGDWNSNFNETSKTLFKKYAGNELIKLGYESNLDW